MAVFTRGARRLSAKNGQHFTSQNGFYSVSLWARSGHLSSPPLNLFSFGPCMSADKPLAPINTGLLSMCMFVMAMGEFNYAMLAPFLPAEASRFGISNSKVGIIFSAMPFAVLVTTPFAPSATERFGSHAVITGCVLSQALLTTLFTSSYLQSNAFFPIACILRVGQGFSSGFLESAAGGFVVRMVPENMVTDVVGWSSAARSVGLMLGPPFGGFMYQVGGFHLPFAVAASMLCVSAIGFIFISRQRKPQAVSGQHQTELVADGKNTSAVPFGQLLRLPSVWGSCLSNVVCYAALSYHDPTLQPFLEEAPYHLSETSVGFILTAAVISFTVFSSFAGQITRMVGPPAQFFGGFITMGISFFLLGPSPFLDSFVPQHVIVTVVSMVLSGASLAQVMVPTVPVQLDAGQSLGYTISELSMPCSTLAVFSITLGSISGPLIASALVQSFGFRWASTAYAIFLTACAPIVFLILNLSSSTGIKKAAQVR